MALEDPVLRTAAGLDPTAASALAAQDAVLQAVPVFPFDFKSESFPGLDGPVEMRYATVGDSLAIERVMGPMAGFVAEAIASLEVLITKAPASWYQAPEKGGLPLLNLRRLPDVEALLALYRAYSRWRADFRSTGASV